MPGTFHVLFLIDNHPRLVPMVAQTAQECEHKAYKKMEFEIHNWMINFKGRRGRDPQIGDFQAKNWRVELYASLADAQKAERVYKVCFEAKDAVRTLYKKMGINICSVCAINMVDEGEEVCHHCKEKAR